MAKKNLDDIDHRILSHLAEDGRRPTRVIAADVGLSESSVRQRIARMRRDNVFRIAATTNLPELGYVTAGVGLRVVGGSLDEIAERLAAIPEVNFVSICSGTCDISVGIATRDHEQLIHALVDRIRSVGDVQVIEMRIHARVIKNRLEW